MVSQTVITCRILHELALAPPEQQDAVADLFCQETQQHGQQAQASPFSSAFTRTGGGAVRLYTNHKQRPSFKHALRNCRQISVVQVFSFLVLLVAFVPFSCLLLLHD